MTRNEADGIASASARLDELLVEGRPAEAAGLFTEDAVLGESGMADVIGRAAIAAFLERGDLVRRVAHHLLHRDELIMVSADRAIEFGWFDEIKVPHGQAPIAERGRTVTDWRREADGQWRIARLVISDLEQGRS